MYGPGDELADAVLPAIKLLIQEGVADSMRIGPTGTSAGGYATLALLTRSSASPPPVVLRGALGSDDWPTRARAGRSSVRIGWPRD